MRNALRLLVLVTSLTASRWASAEEAQPALVEPPVETGLATQQILLGTVSAVIAGFGGVGIALSDHTRSYEISAAFMAAAVLPGLAVCVTGASSRWYDGSCVGPAVGAYLGLAAVAIPAGLAARGAIFSSKENDTPSAQTVLLVWAAGAVGSAVGATIGWHLTKHRRPAPVSVARAEPPPSPPPRAFWPEMPVRQLRAAPGSVAVPLLAFSF